MEINIDGVSLICGGAGVYIALTYGFGWLAVFCGSLVLSAFFIAAILKLASFWHGRYRRKFFQLGAENFRSNICKDRELVAVRLFAEELLSLVNSPFKTKEGEDFKRGARFGVDNCSVLIRRKLKELGIKEVPE